MAFVCLFWERAVPSILDFCYMIGKLCVMWMKPGKSLLPLKLKYIRSLLFLIRCTSFCCLYSWKVHWSPARRHMTCSAVKLIVQDHQCSRMKNSSRCNSRCHSTLWIFNTFVHFLLVPYICISFSLLFLKWILLRWEKLICFVKATYSLERRTDTILKNARSAKWWCIVYFVLVWPIAVCAIVIRFLIFSLQKFREEVNKAKIEAERLNKILLEKQVYAEVCTKDLDMKKTEIANLNQRISEVCYWSFCYHCIVWHILRYNFLY